MEAENPVFRHVAVQPTLACSIVTDLSVQRRNNGGNIQGSNQNIFSQSFHPQHRRKERRCINVDKTVQQGR